MQSYKNEYTILTGNCVLYLLAFWHYNYVILIMKTTATKTKSIKSVDLVSAIDKQLQAILANDIRKIDNVNIKNAAFLSLIAA